MITNNSSLCIHSGTRVSFWYDKWIGTSSLEICFYHLCKLDRHQFGSLADHITPDGAWRFDFKRIHNNLEVTQLAGLLNVIGSDPPVIDTLPDTGRWQLHNSGVFSVKSLYHTLTVVAGVDNFPHHFVNKNGVPPKVSLLLWCAVHGILNSLDMLNRKGMEVYSSCILCGNCNESQEHLLLHCKVAYKTWMAVMPKTHWAWVFPETMYSLAHSWSHSSLSSNGKVVWDLIPSAIVWILWRERNCRIFEDKYSFKTDSEIVVDVKALVLSWASAAGNRVHMNFSNSVYNWETVFD
ncbi:uncharacterized protein LOC113352163 [Papaver somniferum]|uniref:uncharacterized protein LOC113352163 n=1 Tax=Papaver somniferum TaxID=3469 RepID=UPI000E6FE4ED|nr:uncharacterized protein LOC113352163 [Papaver somniferum]